MSVISEKLNIINTAKNDIKTAIENKGVVVGDVSISDYASKINEISSGGGADFEINDCSYLFYKGAKINIVDELLKLCKNVTSVEQMFYQCTTLKNLDLSSLDIGTSTNMQYMFYSCQALENLDLSNFNTENVTNMNYMFNMCYALKNLDVSSFNTKKVQNMSSMFAYSRELAELDLSNFDTSTTRNMDLMFYQCTGLTSLNISNFDFSKATAIGNILAGCSQLQNLNFGVNLGKGFTQKSNNYGNYTLNLSSSTKLTHDSLMSVINGLYDLNLTYDVANGGTLYTQQLQLGSTNMAKLTADEITIATNKGWVVS